MAACAAVALFIFGGRHLIGGKSAHFQRVSFETLAGFEYKDKFDQTVPEKIRALNGKDISVRGFMFPLESDGERLTTFMLVKDQVGCCFGGTPKVNHWIYVQMAEDKKADYVDSVPVTVYGKMSIGETTIEEMKGLYCMKADRVWAPRVNENRVIDN
jgi:hypothetical protein